jgi:multiple sugar transport system substrate-binding protein
MKPRIPGMFTRYTRREFLRNAGLAAAGAGAAAAMPALLGRTAADQPVTIQYWNGWTEEAAKKITGIANNFTKKNPNIIVQDVVVSGSSADLNAKLLAAVAAGSPPDVVTFFGANNIYTMADQQALIPLDEVATPQQINQMKKWVAPAVWDLGTYKGRVYGIAQWCQAWALIWNKKQAQAAGLDITRGVQSLDDLQHWAMKLTQHDSHGNIIRLGFYDDWLDRWLAPFGGQFTDAKGHITANHPNNVRALEYLVSFASLYDPKKVAAFNASLNGAGERSANLDPLLTGKISMQINGPWELGAIHDFAPAGFTYGTSFQPSPKDLPGLGTYTYGDIPCVPRGAPHPKEAWEFIAYLTGASGDHTQYVDLFKAWTCVNAPVSENMLGIAPFKAAVTDVCAGYDKFSTAFFHAKRYLFPPKLPISSFYDTTLGTYVSKAMLLQMTPKAALDEVQKLVVNEWQQYQATHKS